EKHDLRNLTLIGHSMGGNLATEVAAAMPERVKQLIIVDAIPCTRALMMPGVDAKHIRYDSLQVTRMLRMSEDSLRQTVVMTAQNMTTRPEKADTLVRWTMQADRETYVYGYTDLLKMDLRPQLNRITAPTLILGASFPDEKVVRENYTKQYANLASKDIRIAPDSRHFVMFDQPKWLYEQINLALTTDE
ncbi:MAG: alpha/beta hydrolase, partial [Tunicatimonas sp.]